MEDILQFIQTHGPKKLREWQPENLKNFVSHYSQHNQIMTVRQADKSIVGVAFVRVINRRKKDHQEDSFRVSEEGNTVHIAALVTRHRYIIPRLWNLMVKRFGTRKFISNKRRGTFRWWTFEHYERKMNLLRHF